MEALELLNDLEDQGLSLKAKRDRLLVMPSKKITESTRSLIRQNKAELLRLIKPAAVSGYQIGQLKCLYYPPGISAADLLVVISISISPFACSISSSVRWTKSAQTCPGGSRKTPKLYPLECQSCLMRSGITVVMISY